jgi:uncharacterized membrane protein
MSAHDQRESDRATLWRFRYDTPEFGRVTSLSDGVFAIALTLLVLTLDVPDVPADQLARALMDQGQQVVVFGLSFLLVANVWWVHHRIVSRLAMIEPGLIALNFVLLALVALVPFPTSLVGSNPTERAAVLPFLAVFALTALVIVGGLARARRVNAWREAMPDEVYPWLLLGFGGQAFAMVLAMGVALLVPLAGLVVGAMAGVASWGLVGVFGPSAHRQWV